MLGINKFYNMALYARVSTEDQNVKQQMDTLKKWAKKNDYKISKVIMDTESASKPLKERRRFLRLIEETKQGKIDGVGILNLDRLTRNWEDVVFIEKHFREMWSTCKLVSISDEINLKNANGRFMFRIKMAFCCFMPEDMREKQIIGIERAKRQGKYKGRKPGAKNKEKNRGRSLSSPKKA